MNYVKGFGPICLLIFVFNAPASVADTGNAHPYLTEKFFFDAGIYFPERKLRISVDRQNGDPGRSVDFDNELDLNRSDQTAAFNFGWRISRHWKFAAQYFRSSDNVTATLEEEIEWGDILFPVNAEVQAGQKFSLTRTLIGYEFNDSAKQTFGIGGGLHILDISAYIEGEVSLGGTPVIDGRSVHATGPLPNIGAWYRYSMTDKWVLTARYDWLSAEIGDFKGRLVNASFGINYQWFQHFGVGANYNYFELDIGVNKDDWVGTAVTSYDGLYIYLSAYW